MTLLPGLDLEEWHNYSIDWSSDGVTFRIDDDPEPPHVEGVPTGNLRLDVWVDNVVYDTHWNHIYQDIPPDTSLDLDSIAVYSLSAPYAP